MYYGAGFAVLTNVNDIVMCAGRCCPVQSRRVARYRTAIGGRCELRLGRHGFGIADGLAQRKFGCVAGSVCGGACDDAVAQCKIEGAVERGVAAAVGGDRNFTEISFALRFLMLVCVVANRVVEKFNGVARVGAAVE